MGIREREKFKCPGGFFSVFCRLTCVDHGHDGHGEIDPHEVRADPGTEGHDCIGVASAPA